MSEQQNIDLVRRGYEAFGRGDLAGLLSLFDEQIKWVTPGPTDLPTAGTRRGRDSVQQFFGTLAELFDFQRFEPKEFIAQGDRVIVLGEDTVRLKATGAVFDLEWAHAFSVKNDKIVTFNEYLDTAAIVAELRTAAV
jgi:hypothetical protein